METVSDHRTGQPPDLRTIKPGIGVILWTYAIVDPQAIK
jgi:hypothetical protein